MEFLDRKKRIFDWANAELEDDVLPPEKAHPEIPAQIPGIDLASEQDDTDDVVEIFERTDDEDAFDAARNAGLEKDNDAATAGVSTAVDLVVLDDVDDDVVGSQERRSDIDEDVIQVDTIKDEDNNAIQVETVPDEIPTTTLAAHVADKSATRRRHWTYVLILTQTRDLSRHVSSCDCIIRVGASTSSDVTPTV